MLPFHADEVEKAVGEPVPAGELVQLGERDVERACVGGAAGHDDRLWPRLHGALEAEGGGDLDAVLRGRVPLVTGHVLRAGEVLGDAERAEGEHEDRQRHRDRGELGAPEVGGELGAVTN